MTLSTNTMMTTKINDTPSVALLRYEMGEGVMAFSTMRHGAGVSQGNYADFNINRYCGDDPEAVRRNRGLFCQTVGVDDDRLVFPHQTHGTEVRLIDDAFFSLSADAQATTLEGVDAVMTQLHDVCVGVSTADCIPVLLYDQEHHAVCAVHAGWRGTVARIAEKAVGAMQMTFHTDPAHLCAVIGPGISMKNFEVGEEVYQAFADAGFDMSAIARRYAKWHIDLPLCNQLQLTAVGVPSSQIHQSGICTYDACDRFFSARRLGVQSGRIFSGILLV